MFNRFSVFYLSFFITVLQLLPHTESIENRIGWENEDDYEIGVNERNETRGMPRKSLADEIYEANNRLKKHGEDEAKEIVILEESDPFAITATDTTTNCMYVSEKEIPDAIKGKKTFMSDCNPQISASTADKCELYITSTVTEMSHVTCLKPTQLMCDPATKKCVCGHEGIAISPIRFQFGNYRGKNATRGRCFIRPTFEYIQGFECAPGTERQEVKIEAPSDTIPLCSCKGEVSYDHFDSTDPDWWKCATASSIGFSKWLFLFTVMNLQIIF